MFDAEILPKVDFILRDYLPKRVLRQNLVPGAPPSTITITKSSSSLDDDFFFASIEKKERKKLVR